MNELLQGAASSEVEKVGLGESIVVLKITPREGVIPFE